jgi:hypothetical protein
VPEGSRFKGYRDLVVQDRVIPGPTTRVIVWMRWDLIDLKMALFHVRSLKNGMPSVHPLHGSELRALRRLKMEYPGLAYVFISERGSPLTARAIRHIILREHKNPGEIAVVVDRVP